MRIPNQHLRHGAAKPATWVHWSNGARFNRRSFSVARANAYKKIVPCAPLTKLDGEAIKSHQRRTQVMRAGNGAIFGTDNGWMIPVSLHAQARCARLQLFCNTASQFTHA